MGSSYKGREALVPSSAAIRKHRGKDPSYGLNKTLPAGNGGLPAFMDNYHTERNGGKFLQGPGGPCSQQAAIRKHRGKDLSHGLSKTPPAGNGGLMRSSFNSLPFGLHVTYSVQPGKPGFPALTTATLVKHIGLVHPRQMPQNSTTPYILCQIRERICQMLRIPDVAVKIFRHPQPSLPLHASVN